MTLEGWVAAKSLALDSPCRSRKSGEREKPILIFALSFPTPPPPPLRHHQIPLVELSKKATDIGTLDTQLADGTTPVTEQKEGAKWTR